MTECSEKKWSSWVRHSLYRKISEVLSEELAFELWSMKKERTRSENMRKDISSLRWANAKALEWAYVRPVQGTAKGLIWLVNIRGEESDGKWGWRGSTRLITQDFLLWIFSLKSDGKPLEGLVLGSDWIWLTYEVKELRKGQEEKQAAQLRGWCRSPGGLTSGWTGWYRRGSDEAGLRTVCRVLLLNWMKGMRKKVKNVKKSLSVVKWIMLPVYLGNN